MNHLPDRFQLGTAGPDDYLQAYRWVNDGNVSPVLHGRFQRDDGPIDAYAKLMDVHLPEGQIECLNEISGWLLARACGLPVAPSAFLACIRAGDLPNCAALQARAPAAGNLIYFFCTEQISNAQARGVVPTEELLDEQARWAHAHATLAMDEWLGNTDRHLNNLVRTGKDRFTLIDHGQLLRRADQPPPWWQPDELPDLVDTQFQNLLHHHIFLCRNITAPGPVNAAFQRCADSAESQDHNMRSALHEIAFWCGTIAPGHSAQWLHFLHERVKRAKDLLASRFRVLNFA